MNERLKQLAEQAGCKVMDDGEWYIPSATGLEKVVYTSGVGLEKFAELIVLECANAAMDGTKEGDHYAMRIENHFDNSTGGVLHFGVEE